VPCRSPAANETQQACFNSFEYVFTNLNIRRALPTARRKAKSRVMYLFSLLRRIRSHPSKSNSCISPTMRRINANSRISGLYGPGQCRASSLRMSSMCLSVRSSSRLACAPSVTVAERRSVVIDLGIVYSFRPRVVCSWGQDLFRRLVFLSSAFPCGELDH